MKALNVLYTMIALARSGGLCHDRRMARRNPIGGGFLLILPIVLGFGGGLATGQPMAGVVLGLAVGILLALIVWGIDRSRGRG